MSDKKSSKGTDATRVQPGQGEELSEEALESVAGGCQVGCSNMNSCLDPFSATKDGGPLVINTTPVE